MIPQHRAWHRRGEGSGTFTDRGATSILRPVPGENAGVHCGERGFTLLELLTVMTILGLLAAVLLPALSRAKTKSQRIVCLGNLHQTGIALRMYLDQSRGAYPFVASLPSANARGLSCWFDALATTVPNVRWGEGIFKCPAYLGIHYEGESTRDAEGELTAVYYPCGSYAFNAAGRRRPIAGTRRLVSPGLGFSIAHGEPITRPVRERDLAAPGDLYVFGDAPLVVGLWGPVTTVSLGGAADYNSFQADAPFFEYAQHASVFNMLFADSHAASIRTEVLLGADDSCRSRWNHDHRP